MDSEYTYQPQFIWKQTALDGLLAVTNFTEEVKEDDARKRGGKASKDKQIGVITKFNEDGAAEEVEDGDEDEVEGEAGGIGEDEKMAKSLANGSYIYLGKRQQYAIVKSKKSDTLITVKIRQPGSANLGCATSSVSGGAGALGSALSGATSKSSSSPPGDFDEVEIDITEEDVKIEVEVPIRVVISEDKRFSLNLKRPSNDKLKLLAEDLGELLGLSKYALTFFFNGDKVGLNERLGDREIGSAPLKNAPPALDK